MKAVYLPYRLPLNMKLLSAAFEIQEDSPVGADFAICAKTVPETVEPKRCILYQSEPPLSGHRRELYGSFARYHTVICFDPRGGNEFPFVPSDENPALYPYSPGLNLDRTRGSTAITQRGVFYAGRLHEAMAKVPDCYGSINLYGVRHNICRWLLEHYPQTTVLGQGWPETTKPHGRHVNFRRQKQIDIEQYGSDFVLCMENSMLPGYISEKIHDGFSSDRVTVYLGEPNIEEHVPTEAFVCINHLLDRETKEFDYQALAAIMREMTQSRYDAITAAARQWRKSLVGKHQILRDRLTEFVIARGEAL